MAKTATKETASKEVSKKSSTKGDTSRKDSAKKEDVIKEEVKSLTLEDIADADKCGEGDIVEREWRGVKMKIKPRLDAGEIMFFCDSTIESVFDENTNAYRPELVDIALKGGVVMLYTDLVLPKDSIKMFYILCGTDLVEFVLENVDIKQYDTIVNSIKTRAHYMAEASVKMVEKKIEEVYNSVAGLVDNFSNMFNGVSGQDLQNMISAISDGGIDEQKLIKAYVENMSNG